MSQVSYTERQTEAANILKDVSPELLDEIVTIVGEAEKQNKMQKDYSDRTQKEESDAQIRMNILNESDWRKKASLSALLISRSFE